MFLETLYLGQTHTRNGLFGFHEASLKMLSLLSFLLCFLYRPLVYFVQSAGFALHHHLSFPSRRPFGCCSPHSSSGLAKSDARSGQSSSTAIMASNTGPRLLLGTVMPGLPFHIHVDTLLPLYLSFLLSHLWQSFPSSCFCNLAVLSRPFPRTSPCLALWKVLSSFSAMAVQRVDALELPWKVVDSVFHCKGRYLKDPPLERVQSCWLSAQDWHEITEQCPHSKSQPAPSLVSCSPALSLASCFWLSLELLTHGSAVPGLEFVRFFLTAVKWKM